MSTSSSNSLAHRIRFCHSFDKNNSKGGVTLAYRINEDTVSLGYAFCSDRDSYSRKMGNSIASGRLSKIPLVVTKEEIVRGGNVTYKDIIEFALREETIELYRTENNL